MRTVLQKLQITRSRQRLQRVHVAKLATIVDRQYAYRSVCNLAFDIRNVHKHRLWIDIRENRCCSQSGHATGGREKCEAWQDYLIAGLNFGGHESQKERVAPGRTTDGVIDL